MIADRIVIAGLIGIGGEKKREENVKGINKGVLYSSQHTAMTDVRVLGMSHVSPCLVCCPVWAAVD